MDFKDNRTAFMAFRL